MAKQKGLKGIAITDHDTVDAYNEDLFLYAKSKNIQLINAVEISTKWEKCGIHVLGYNFDLNDKSFRESLYKLRNIRHIYLYDVAEKLNELGYYLNVEELDKIDAVTLVFEAGVATSRSDARRAIQQGGISVNSNKVEAIDETFDKSLFEGEGVVLKKGKKTFRKVTIKD